MSTPAGHTLGAPQRFTNGTKTIYRYECACGLAVYGPRLQHAMAAHDVHLATVKALSMRSHPSRRDR